MASSEVGDGEGEGEVMRKGGEEEEWREVFEWEVGFPVEKVWAVTCEFGKMDKWAPTLVASCSVVEGEAQEVGCVRRVEGRPPDPAAETPYSLEKLLELDPAAHKLSYLVLYCSIPFFVGLSPTFHLLPSPTSSASAIIRWSYRMRPLPSIDRHSLRALLSTCYEVYITDLLNTLSSPPSIPDELPQPSQAR